MRVNRMEKTNRSLRWLALLLAALLLAGGLVGALAEAPQTAGSLFDNAEIMSLIDENYQQVLENGYTELRIPMSLHGITEDVCLSDDSLREQADFWNADAWWEPEDVADAA